MSLGELLGGEKVRRADRGEDQLGEVAEAALQHRLDLDHLTAVLQLQVICGFIGKASL